MYPFSRQSYCCLWYQAWGLGLARVVVKWPGSWVLWSLQRCWSCCGAGGRICFPSRLQKPLNTSLLWLWVKWWIYPQKFELFTLEFLMVFPSYCAVYVALLLSAFSSHQLPFFRPISLLIKPRPPSILSHVFWSIPLVNQVKSSDLKADIAENQLGSLTFLFNVCMYI